MLSLLSNLWSKDEDSPKPITKEALTSRLAQYGIRDEKAFYEKLAETGGTLVGLILCEPAMDLSANRTLTLLYTINNPEEEAQYDQMKSWVRLFAKQTEGYTSLLYKPDPSIKSIATYRWFHLGRPNRYDEYWLEILGLDGTTDQYIRDHPDWPQFTFDGQTITRV